MTDTVSLCLLTHSALLAKSDSIIHSVQAQVLHAMAHEPQNRHLPQQHFTDNATFGVAHTGSISFVAARSQLAFFREA